MNIRTANGTIRVQTKCACKMDCPTPPSKRYVKRITVRLMRRSSKRILISNAE